MPARPVAVTARAAMSRTRSVAWMACWRVSDCMTSPWCGGVHLGFPAGGQRPATARQRFGNGSGRHPRPYHPTVARILLAEDDEGIRLPLVRALEREGHEVEAVATGTDAAAAGVGGEHDLLVLDIGLPRVGGLDVCQPVRALR